MGQFKIKELEAGNLKVENFAVQVVDHPTVSAISNVVGPIDGIVGFNLFARYKMTIDYQKKEMTFTPNDYTPPDTMQAIMKLMLSPAADRNAPKVLAPGALFGFRVDKESTDKDAGVVVKEVMPESPAAKAGLKAGDQPVDARPALDRFRQRLLLRRQPGASRRERPRHRPPRRQGCEPDHQDQRRAVISPLSPPGERGRGFGEPEMSNVKCANVEV